MLKVFSTTLKTAPLYVKLSFFYLSGGPEGLHAPYLLLEGREDLGVEAGEGDVDVGVHGQADQQGEPGGGQQAQAQAGQDTHQPANRIVIVTPL